MVDAFLDASVLIPALLADTLLRGAEAELYHPRWSDDVLLEVRRNLVQAGLATEERAGRRVIAMRESFPTAAVTGYQELVARMTSDPMDRHVLAAAVKANSGFIVTNNLRHFPLRALAPHGIEVLSPDEFLLRLDNLDHTAMAAVLQSQAADLRRPPMTIRDVLVHLATHAPRFVTRFASEPDDFGN